MFDFKKELHQLITEEVNDESFKKSREEAGRLMEILNKSASKIYKKQSEMDIRMEEMYSIMDEFQTDKEGWENREKQILQDCGRIEEEVLGAVNVIIGMADLLEDFYIFYKDNHDEEMSAQSGQMWESARKYMAGMGLSCIHGEGTAYNPDTDKVYAVESHDSLDNGMIIKVIKSGYVYKTKVIRKELVTVNRKEQVIQFGSGKV